MISAITNWIPDWWYIGLIIAPLLLGVLAASESKSNDSLPQFILGVVLGLVIWVAGSIGLVVFYYMVSILWFFSLGLFFPTIWDIPLTVWILLAVFALIAAVATPAYEYIVLILRISK